MPVVLTSTPIINTESVTEVLTLVKSVMGLFTEYPLNIMLIAGLCTVGFGIFRSAKGAAM